MKISDYALVMKFNIEKSPLTCQKPTDESTSCLNKAYRPNAHLLYIVMHYNVNIMVIMVLYNFTLLFQPLEQTLITQTQV